MGVSLLLMMAGVGGVDTADMHSMAFLSNSGHVL